MLVYYFVLFIVSNRYLLFWVSNGHNSINVQNRTHVYMNFYDHKDLGNHFLQLCPKVVKHPVCWTPSRFHCIMLVFIPISSGCFTAHYFMTCHMSSIHHLCIQKFLYGEYCCIFLWFIVVHFVIFCLENYCWIQQCLVMLLYHCCSCPSLSTDRFQEMFLIRLRNFGHQCFVCLLVYLVFC